MSEARIASAFLDSIVVHACVCEGGYTPFVYAEVKDFKPLWFKEAKPQEEEREADEAAGGAGEALREIVKHLGLHAMCLVSHAVLSRCVPA